MAFRKFQPQQQSQQQQQQQQQQRQQAQQQMQQQFADENSYREREIRYFENESLDSLVVHGLDGEYLILAYPGACRVGRISTKGRQLGLTSSSLQFSLITFTDVLVACEAMMSSVSHKQKGAGPSSLFAKKKVTKAKFARQLDGNSKLEEEGTCFYIEETSRYRLACFAHEDGTVSLGRVFSKFDITHGTEGEAGHFEISKISLLRFESIGHYVKFLKSLSDLCISAYSKRSFYVPIVFFMLNKIDNMTKSERDALYANKAAALENMLPQAARFAGDESSYASSDCKKFFDLIPLSVFLIEEILFISTFFKNQFRYLCLGPYYLGDHVDTEGILNPKKIGAPGTSGIRGKKKPTFPPINLDIAKKAAATAENVEEDTDEDEMDDSPSLFSKIAD